MAETHRGSIALPAEDSAIGEALDQLDIKLTAWIESVSEVQQALEDRSERITAALAQAPSQGVAAVEAPVAEPVGQAPESSEEPAANTAQHLPPATATVEESRPVVEDAASLDEPPVEQADDTRPLDSPAAAEQCSTPDTDLGGSGSESELDPLESKRQQEKELLESLDPKVRMEIRIRRRLDSSKSVRELLNEILAASPPPEESAKDRKWWKRGGRK